MNQLSIRAIILSGVFALGAAYTTLSLASSAYRASTVYVGGLWTWQDKRHSGPPSDIVSNTQIKGAPVAPGRFEYVRKIGVKK